MEIKEKEMIPWTWGFTSSAEKLEWTFRNVRIFSNINN